MPYKEAKARIKINKMLEESGWLLLNNNSKKANVELEKNIDLKCAGDDFEKIEQGFIDYLLLDDNSSPLCVLEAKRSSKNPFDGKEQARRYANSVNARFIILSNGDLHYLWDLKIGEPQKINKFPTQEELLNIKSWVPDKQELYEINVESDYIALSQDKNYKISSNKEIRFLRDYQLKAIKAIQNAVKNNKNRFLLEMATGTGKTLTSAAIVKLFLQSGNATRILFLVDRIELEQQAFKNLSKYLQNDYHVCILKNSFDNWNVNEVVISTIQTLMSNDKYKEFSPKDFNMIISDEAHRCLGGNSRAVFEYFVGYKLGLTATPKDYLKNITNEDKDNIKNLEKRELLDTYKTFGCDNSEPTFKYSLVDGVKDGYLINPFVVDARTDITTKLLSDEGYEIEITESNKEEKQIQILKQKDFEKRFFSEKTNISFCKAFMENALRDPISDEIGKTLVFCVSQEHASKITQILNKLARIYFPNKYDSDFAIQITSNIPNAQEYAQQFTEDRNCLLGTSKWLNEYKTSKARICCTVGMMTTGYDCQDLLNICLMRPIFSPTDFVQIKGRGTRKYTFKYEDENDKEIKKEKTTFKLFDFFGNYEFFEEKFDYNQKLELPKEKTINSIPKNLVIEKANFKKYENLNPDNIASFNEIKITKNGMKIDRELFNSFSKKIANDSFIRNEYNKGNLNSIKDYLIQNVFDKPSEYYNLDKIKASLNINRRITIEELLDYIFKNIEIKNKEEILKEEFLKFINANNLVDRDKYFLQVLENLFISYLNDDIVRNKIDDGKFQELADNNKLSYGDCEFLQKNKEGIIQKTINYIKNFININKFLN